MKLTCFRIPSAFAAGDKLPDRVKILGWGENPSVKGVAPKVTARTLASVPAAQVRHGFSVVALDYEHNTLPGSPEFKRTSEPRKVAGYGAVSVVEGDGIYMERMAYTPSGHENAREFIDLSPVVEMDEATGEVLFVHSAALCRQGAIDALHFFTVDLTEPKQGDAMDLKPITDAIAALQAEFAALKTSFAALSAKSPEGLAEFTAKVTAIEGKLTQFSAEWKAELEQRDRQAILEGAARDGKVVALSAEAAGKLSVADLTAHVAALPVTVPLHQRTAKKDQPAGATGASLIEQYNAISDPVARAAFYTANREKLVGRR